MTTPTPPFDYQTEVLKTLATDKEFFGSHVEAIPMLEALTEFMVSADVLEQYKKQFVYGKNLPDAPATTPIEPENNQILHAMLGIAGETGEVLGATTKDEVRNEVGDLLWYVALLLDQHDLTFDEVMRANIEKLRVKYAGGQYTREEALNPVVR